MIIPSFFAGLFVGVVLTFVTLYAVKVSVRGPGTPRKSAAQNNDINFLNAKLKKVG